MKPTNTNDNVAKAKSTQTYKNVIEKIISGGMVSESSINPSLINFMPENDNSTYYICYDCMSCNARIPFSDIDSIEREICKTAFGGWNIWGTWEANLQLLFL